LITAAVASQAVPKLPPLLPLPLLLLLLPLLLLLLLLCGHCRCWSLRAAATEVSASLLTLLLKRPACPYTRRLGGSSPKQQQMTVTLSEVCMRSASSTSSCAQRCGSLCSRSLSRKKGSNTAAQQAGRKPVSKQASKQHRRF
jgi:hypothetical protein